MDGLVFGLARLEHAMAIAEMRRAAGEHLAGLLGPGHWAGSSLIPGIRERIRNADPTLRHTTLYVASLDGQTIASVAVSTFPPGFWKRSYWSEPHSAGLGVFALVVHPAFQRRGIGRAVMEAVEGLARHRGIPFVRLDAYSVNPNSNAFYSAIGYDRRAEIDLRGTGLVLFEKRVVPKSI